LGGASRGSWRAGIVGCREKKRKTEQHKGQQDKTKNQKQEAIRNRVASSSMGVWEASSRTMHLVKEMDRDVADINTVEVPEEFFNKTFICHLMLDTGETSRRNEGVHALHENHAEFHFNKTRYRGDADIYIYGAIKCLTNLKNHLAMNVKRFMIRSIFAI